MMNKIEVKTEKESIGGFDESLVINKDYLNSLEGIYKCSICFKIMDNPTDCETCGHSFCYECIKNLNCPFKCKEKKLKPSSQNLKDILSKLKFKCPNKGCEQILNYTDVKRHNKICDFQEIICPNKGCNKKLLKKNLENHVLNECQFSLVKCPYCDYQFNKNEITKHEKSCSLVNNSLKDNKLQNNDINSYNDLDDNKIDTNEYIKLLSMNVSKIVKDNKELMDINNNSKNDDESKQKIEFSQVAFRPSNPANYAQIDEEELLNLITEGIDEELKKYFLDFDKNFLKLSKDIKDIKEHFNNKQNKVNELKNKKSEEKIEKKGNNNILIIDETGDLNRIDPIKEVKETEEEDNLNEIYKDYIKDTISKTEENIKNTISDMNEKILEKLKEFNNKLEEHIKKNIAGNNNNLTNQQKLIIENINNSIDKIIENIQETKSKINILSNDLHNKTPLLEDLNKNLKEQNSKDNLTEVKKEQDKEKEDNLNEEIENIETTLNLVKSSLKQVIKTITEEFADLTELINTKKNKDNLVEDKKNEIILNKKENLKENALSIDSLHKFSFGMDISEKIQSPNMLISNMKSSEQIFPDKLLKLKNQNFFLKKLDSNNSELKLNKKLDSFNPDNKEEFNSNLNLNIINKAKQSDTQINTNINNLENRMINLENYAKNAENEIKQSISIEFNNQVKNFNSIIEKNLENKIGKMFSLKYCKECEKVDYFYGFKKCTSCENEICKECISLCINCKILFCKKCCTCLKCNKSYCSSCRILCTECNKKYCKNCLTNCSTCNKLLCLLCIKQCLNCKNNNCDSYCSKTCYICNKNICNKCIDISEIKIINCSSCNKNICEECSKVCEFCKKKICKNCEKSCNKCNLKICKHCVLGIGGCFDCKKIFCKNCATDNLQKKCDLCNNIFCKDCENNFKKCYLCNNDICKNCCSECLCGNIFCNTCSLECEKCGRRVCNNCSAKCVCDIAIFCNECLKQNNETVLMHDCLYFINDSSIFDKKKTRSKISFNINNNSEIKLYVSNISKISKLFIGLTDNGFFKENAEEEISNIYVINLINGKKFSSEINIEESFIDNNYIKEENITVYLMVKNKQLLFKINDSEYKAAFDLSKEQYWIYLEKINSENNSISKQNNSNNNTNSELISDDFNQGIPKIKFIYAKSI